MMSDLVLIYSLFPNAGDAHDCCRILLEERLIASANRLAPAICYINGDKDVEISEGHPVFFNTSSALAEAAIERITDMHGYAVPTTVAIPASHAGRLFAHWVETVVTK
ncbi:MAG: divalent cation tolerance protein CutA [Sphingorhabdus sp.]